MRRSAIHESSPTGTRLPPAGIVVSVALLCAAILATDLALGRNVNPSGLYIVPILISFWLGKRSFTVGAAALCSGLALVGLGFGEHEALLHLLVNRLVAVFVIWAVVSLGLIRMRIERALFEARETATTTLTSIADAVITTDTLRRIAFLNPVAERMTGCAREEALGRPLEEIFRVSEEKPALPPIVELEEHGIATVVEGILHSRDGQRTPIEERRAPLRDGDGAVHGHVLVFRDVTERREHEEAMRRMAYRDELTGLPNRTSLADRLTLELAHARRNRECLGVLYLDLDDFKEVNDRLGHHAGDALLQAVGERLRASLRGGDTVARLGGDEFAVLLPGVAGPAEARRVGRKVLDALCAPVPFEEGELRTTASAGVAIFPRDGEEPETLLRRADKAMYRAKQLGGGQVVLHAGEQERGQARRRGARNRRRSTSAE